MINIITFKWDTGKIHPKKKSKFTAEHVNILSNMLRRHVTVPYKLKCITDDANGIYDDIECVPLWDDYRDLGGCYVRLKAFSNTPDMKKILGEKFIWIDLDCVIVDNIDHILKTPHEFCAWGDTHPRTPYNGSLIMCKTGTRQHVWKDFKGIESTRCGQRIGYVGTDQAWIGYRLGRHEKRWTTSDGIYSLRMHFIKKGNQINLPSNAKIIMFHGKHDPSHRDIQQKYPWVREHWK